MQCWYIPCNEFHPEKFKQIFGKDYYLHATSQNATFILSEVKKSREGSGRKYNTRLFTRPDPEKEKKIDLFRACINKESAKY